MAEQGHKVSLNVYDLGQGLARQLSTTFLGKAIEGIWHTGVVVYGKEYYFGGGIQSAAAGATPYGTLIRVIDLGVTHVPKDVFEMYLQDIGPRFTVETYSLLSHNCDNFSSEVAQFLVSAPIPDYILNLSNEFLSSPMGALILPMIQQMESTLRAGGVPQAPQLRPSTAAASAQTKNKSVSAGGTQSTRSNGDNVDQKSKRESTRQEVDRTTNNTVHPSVGDARSRVQEEIKKEFAEIMATGTLCASEAAALATRKVMQKYGRMNAAKS